MISLKKVRHWYGIPYFLKIDTERYNMAPTPHFRKNCGEVVLQVDPSFIKVKAIQS